MSQEAQTSKQVLLWPINFTWPDYVERKLHILIYPQSENQAIFKNLSVQMAAKL